MASINGRYVRINSLPDKPVGRVSGWKEESDWAMVTFADGSRQQVHFTDGIEVLPANYTQPMRQLDGTPIFARGFGGLEI